MFPSYWNHHHKVYWKSPLNNASSHVYFSKHAIHVYLWQHRSSGADRFLYSDLLLAALRVPSLLCCPIPLSGVCALYYFMLPLPPSCNRRCQSSSSSSHPATNGTTWLPWPWALHTTPTTKSATSGMEGLCDTTMNWGGMGAAAPAPLAV